MPAIDDLQKLQQERMELAKQIHELADKETLSAEDREVQCWPSPADQLARTERWILAFSKCEEARRATGGDVVLHGNFA